MSIQQFKIYLPRKIPHHISKNRDGTELFQGTISVLELKQIFLQEDGQDLIEYVFLFMLIVVTAIVGMAAFGGHVLALYNSVIGTF